MSEVWLKSKGDILPTEEWGRGQDPDSTAIICGYFFLSLVILYICAPPHPPNFFLTKLIDIIFLGIFSSGNSSLISSTVFLHFKVLISILSYSIPTFSYSWFLSLFF